MAVLTAMAGWAAGPGPKPAVPQRVTRMTFDRVAVGQIPAGWKAEATHPRGRLAAWKVTADPQAPSPPNVLSVTPRHRASGGTFNLCWTPAIQFLDGEITVRVRANSGRGDEGGGPMWRVQDRNNYYVARYNPLEHNFRLYEVKNGHRHMLTGASRIPVPKGQWFTIRIVQRGRHIEGWLNGTKLFDAASATFPKAGGVGLWTKADAATSFDNLTVRAAAR